MTISSETRTAGPFTGNGVTTAFPFTFKVFSTADVLVVQTDTDGVETTRTLTTHYTVALNADQDASPGGTVNTVAPLVDDYLLTLTSNVGNLQPVLITNLGGFYPSIINTALDKATILIQQLLNKINRSVKIPLSDGTAITTQLPTASLRANKALVFDTDGNVGVSVDNYTDQVAAVVASAAAAVAAAAASAASAADAAEQAEATITIPSESLILANHGTTARLLSYHLGDSLCPEDFGAAESYSALVDDTTFLDAALAACTTYGKILKMNRFYSTTGCLLETQGERGLTIQGNCGAAVKRGYPNETGFVPFTASQEYLVKTGSGTVDHTNLILQNVTFFGNDATITKAMLWLVVGSMCKASQVSFRRARGAGVYANKMEDFVWSDCQFTLLGNSDGLSAVTFGDLPPAGSIGSNACFFSKCRFEFIDGPFIGIDPAATTAWASSLFMNECKFEVGEITTSNDGPDATYGTNAGNYPCFDFRAGVGNRVSVKLQSPFISKADDALTVYAIGACDDFIVNDAFYSAANSATIDLFRIQDISGNAVLAQNVQFNRATARSFVQTDVNTISFTYINKSIAPIQFEYPVSSVYANSAMLVKQNPTRIMYASTYAYPSSVVAQAMVPDPDPASDPAISPGAVVKSVVGTSGSTMMRLSSTEGIKESVAGVGFVSQIGRKIKIRVRCKKAGNVADAALLVRSTIASVGTTAATITVANTTWEWKTVELDLALLGTDLRINAAGTNQADHTVYLDAVEVEYIDYLNKTETEDPTSLNDGVGTTLSFTVTGAAFGDFVLVAAPYDLQGITVTGYVSAADTVAVRVQNESGGIIDLASGSWKVRVIKG